MKAAFIFLLFAAATAMILAASSIETTTLEEYSDIDEYPADPSAEPSTPSTPRPNITLAPEPEHIITDCNVCNKINGECVAWVPPGEVVNNSTIINACAKAVNGECIAKNGTNWKSFAKNAYLGSLWIPLAIYWAFAILIILGMFGICFSCDDKKTEQLITTDTAAIFGGKRTSANSGRAGAAVGKPRKKASKQKGTGSK